MAARFRVSGLANEWDADDNIRDRLRSGGFLEDTTLGSDPSNRVAVHNMTVVLPLLVRLADASLQLPAVDELRTEIQEFYNMHQRVVTESEIDDSAWFCRKMVVFVKMKASKKLVGLVPRFKQHFAFFMGSPHDKLSL